MRLFVAVDPDEAARRGLDDWVVQARRALGPQAEALRWTPTAQLHITLHFLGEIASGRAGIITAALEPIETDLFDIGLTSVEAHPAGRNPRLLWAPIDEGRSSLQSLQQTIGRSLARAGITVDARPFSPHVTVARVRDRDRHRVTSQTITPCVDPPRVHWTAARFSLYRSDLSGPAPRHTSMLDVPLRAREHHGPR